MRKSRYSDSQILAILKQSEAGAPVTDLCREYGMSSATFYKWRAKYGGMDASMMKRLKELEAENVQPVTERNYSSYVPGQETPFTNAYISTMAHIYPEDRGTNYAIRNGRDIAKLL